MVTTIIPPIFELNCGAQSYDWGKLGSSSKVAQFKNGSDGGKWSLDEGKPYAELWMGTHPSCPSTLASSPNTTLSSLISTDPPALLGQSVVNYFGSDGKPDLPFLFKVLSIRKALSIQAHPDKQLAKRLHAERGDIYKDPNHKPEMALAITDFSGFCGFRPLEEISSFLQRYPEFRSAVTSETADKFISSVKNGDDSQQKEALKDLFEKLMTADSDTVVKPNLRKLVSRVSSQKAKSASLSAEDELILILNDQFPDDVGIFCTFMLNIVELKAGDAVFLRANEPHAYISGDIVECMATSDNVVRAGLTPKLRDVPTLVSMLTYTTGTPSAQLLPPAPFPKSKNGKTKLFDPKEIEEFAVAQIQLDKDGDEEWHDGLLGPSVVIVTKTDVGGSGSLVIKDVSGNEEVVEVKREGQVFFVRPGVQLGFKAGTGGLVAYRAFVEAPHSKM